jgi:hypothetical protein
VKSFSRPVRSVCLISWNASLMAWWAGMMEANGNMMSLNPSSCASAGVQDGVAPFSTMFNNIGVGAMILQTFRTSWAVVTSQGIRHQRQQRQPPSAWQSPVKAVRFKSICSCNDNDIRIQLLARVVCSHNPLGERFDVDDRLAA